jgi:hypothetical protein
VEMLNLLRGHFAFVLYESKTVSGAVGILRV